jgi:uncharacterized protein (DUF885 family)
MTRLFLLASVSLLAACASAPDQARPPMDASTAAAPAPVPVANTELAAFYADYDKAELALSPTSKAYRGIRDADYGKWDEYTDAAAEESRQLDLRTLEEMRRRFPRETLSPEDRLSYDIFVNRGERGELIHPYRKQAFVFDQMNGAQSEGPAFLINIHRVDTLADAEAYLSRLQTLDTYLDQAIAEARARQKLGILPPKWVFPYVIDDARNIVSGAPYGPGADSALFADYKAKVGKLDIPAAEKARLIAAGRKAMVEDVKPAYGRVIALMQEQQKLAGSDDGIWRFPNGAQQYAALLRYYTTTGMDADQIHSLGLAQVARIHQEMRGIMARVGFTGTLQQFFEKMRTDKQFIFPNTDAGRERYLAETHKFNKEMEALLPQYFGTTPKSPLVVKPSKPSAKSPPARPSTSPPPPTARAPAPTTSTCTT